MKIKIEKKKSKFALVGHGFHLHYLCRSLLKNFKNKPIIITHKKKFHLKDIRELNSDEKLYKNIFNLKKFVKIHEVNDINDNRIIKILEKNQITHIFSCSSRFIFRENLINKYKHKIFNIHPAYLPNERGTGTFTNRILKSQYYVCAVVHLIDKNIDTGHIILKSKKYKISQKSKPIDFLMKTNKCYKLLIDQFIKNIKKNKTLKSYKQNEKNKNYFGRYNTSTNGVINWDYYGKDIEIFIRAFSKPYTGAFTYILYKSKSIKIKIYNASFTKNKNFKHPFFSGKIFYQDKTKILVAVKGGVLSIKNKDMISNYKKFNFLRLEGKTFFNTSDDILKSKIINKL